MALARIDLFIIFLYMIGIMLLGTYYARFVDSSEDFYISGKMLPWWAIAMSLVATDISALDFIAASGQGYKWGIVVANFDWIGCLPPMILGAFFIVPFYWRAGVFTIPEYLGLRYNRWVQLIQGILWGGFLTCVLGALYWATGLMLVEFLPIPDDFMGGALKNSLNFMLAFYHSADGNNWQIMTWVIVIAVTVGIYCYAGGLSAVVVTDVAQLVIMYIGGMAIIILGMLKVGGMHGLTTKIYAMGPEFANHFKLFLPADSPSPYPWHGILFGLAFVLAPAYWFGNQAIVQRNLGAKSEWDTKGGMLFGAFLHALIPIMVTFPGLIALALYPGEKTGDVAFPRLIHKLLPPGLTGLVFAVLLAALMSTAASNLNSAATIWMKDIYQKFVVRKASDRHYLAFGRVLTAVFVLFGIAFAPIVTRYNGLYIAIQSFMTFIQGPNLALILLGILWARPTGWGGLAGLLTGLISATLMFIFKKYIFTHEDPFLFIAWWSFVISALTIIIVSLLSKPEPREKLLGLVWKYANKDQALQEALKERVEK
jgi:solute:Na+ symporter, SSS family